MSNAKSELFLVEELPAEGLPSHGEILYWQRPLESPSAGVLSLGDRVESLWPEFAKEYREWARVTAGVRQGSVSLEDFLRTEGGTSLWWGTPVREKSPSKHQFLFSLFRLLALERYAREKKFSKLTFVGQDRSLHLVLQSWAKSTGLQYEAQLAPRRPVKSVTQILNRLPFLIQSLLFAAKYFVRVRKVRASGSAVAPDRSAPIFITYFPNFDGAAAEKGRFRSNYWQGLHELVDGKVKNWFFLFAESPEFSLKRALTFRSQFQKSSKDRFFFLEDFLSPSDFLSAVREYLKFWSRSFSVSRTLKDRCRLSGSEINFFEVLKREWLGSVRGKEALLWLLRDRAFRNFASQVGEKMPALFTWEGQGWEQQLVALWRQRNVGEISGYQHSSLRPLDLRAFVTREEFMDTRRQWPDKLLVNGEGSRRLMIEQGFPSEQLELVEAVRYPALSSSYGSFLAKNTANDRTLLVVADYNRLESEYLIRLLNRADHQKNLVSYQRILVKPHPFCDLSSLLKELSWSLPVELVGTPLTQLFSQADVVLSAGGTTAALEAAWVGIPLIMVSSDRSMNMSPLLGFPGIHFVRNGEDLGQQLANPLRVQIDQSYFSFGSGLPRWQNFLKSWEVGLS